MKGFSVLKSCGLILVVLFLDMISKWFIQSHLPLIGRSPPFYPYGGIPVFHHFLGIEFAIVHEINKGAAWGAFADFQPYLMALRVVLVAVLICYLLFFNRQKSLQIPLTLIIAGAIGNILDFFIYGHVVDMFHFNFGGYYFPVFNIADSAIFIGVVWILFRSIFFQKQPSAKQTS